MKDFVIEKLPALIAKQIATFVNPAGGFGAALKLFGRFATNIDKLTETAKDLKKFVSTLANNADAINKGNTEAVATAVEKAIKDVAPLALDFAFHFMKVASLPNDIVEFVRKQQKRIDGLIDKVLRGGNSAADADGQQADLGVPCRGRGSQPGRA